jgi:ABC-type nitrate/sulfonate/bicarbonate transport system permease component
MSARRLQVWGLRAALVVIVLGAWWYGTGPGGVSSLILPPLPEVLREFIGLFGSDFLLEAVTVTLTEIVLAAVLAVAGGLLVGFLLSRTGLRARAAEPVLAWGYMFPFVLLYPLFLLWMGVGMGSKVAYAAVGASIPVAYNTLRGLRSVDQRYVKVGLAFGASNTQMDLHVKAGAARPMILSGIRIGISIVLISVVLAELLGSNVGLGFELQRASNTFQNARAFALVFLLVLLTTVLQALLERLMSGRRGQATLVSRAR